MSGDRAAWKWTMMIMQPEFVSPELVDTIAADGEARRGLGRPLLARTSS